MENQTTSNPTHADSTCLSAPASKPPPFPILIGVPYLILLCLLLYPPTRALLQMQLRLLRDTSPIRARLREMGVREMPLPAALTWKQTPLPATIARAPEDYAVQVGGVLLKATYLEERMQPSSQEAFEIYQRRYGAGLAAVSAHFSTRPAPYAHMLRFLSQDAVKVAREAEVDAFQTGKPSLLTDRQVGYADSWAVFEQAAAQGEKLDPENAYFPMMRAVWLFDAKRDQEGIAAVLRAGQKPRFDDYSEEEPEAEWTLCQRAYGASTALIHESLAAARLFPHYAALRSLGRLIAYQATRLEQAGHVQEGLALRHAMMQCGMRMCERGEILGVLVGGAIVAIQTNRAMGGPRTPPPANEPIEKRRDRVRDRYLAYLHKIGEEEEAHWFAQADADTRRIRALIDSHPDPMLEDAPRTLSGLWMLDMLLLINTAILLLLCTAAVVCGQIAGGEKALPIVTLALCLGSLAVVLSMQWAEALSYLRLVLANIAGMGDDNGGPTPKFDAANFVREHPTVIHVGEVLLSLALPTLSLLTLGVVSLIRRETYPVSLQRGLQRGVLVLATLLTVAYAGALLATARAENRANAEIVSIARNGVAYLQAHTKSGR